MFIRPLHTNGCSRSLLSNGPVSHNIFIRDLFADAVVFSDYIASSERMIEKKRTEKEAERSGRGLIELPFRNLPGRTE